MINISKTKLSVNINKIATLRNARGGLIPDIAWFTSKIIDWNADGITIHPRPDQRHITIEDVKTVHQITTKKNVELNIEGRPDARYIEIIQEYRPQQATLVPDGPDDITSQNGWRILENEEYLINAFKMIRPYVERISLFIDPLNISNDDILFLKDQNVLRVELYTELFAKNFTNQNKIGPYRECANKALKHGISLNAGHDLNLDNLENLLRLIPEIQEVSIGHALICDALIYGLENTIYKYQQICKKGYIN